MSPNSLFRVTLQTVTTANNEIDCACFADISSPYVACLFFFSLMSLDEWQFCILIEGNLPIFFFYGFAWYISSKKSLSTLKTRTHSVFTSRRIIGLVLFWVYNPFHTLLCTCEAGVKGHFFPWISIHIKADPSRPIILLDHTSLGSSNIKVQDLV